MLAMSQRARNALIIYFDYQRKKAGNGYPGKTVISKIMSGDIGSGQNVRSSIMRR